MRSITSSAYKLYIVRDRFALLGRIFSLPYTCFVKIMENLYEKVKFHEKKKEG